MASSSVLGVAAAALAPEAPTFLSASGSQPRPAARRATAALPGNAAANGGIAAVAASSVPGAACFCAVGVAAGAAAAVSRKSRRQRRGMQERFGGRWQTAVQMAAQGPAEEFGLPPKLAATATALKGLPSDRLRYQQLLALAAKLTPMPEELKTPENKVPGCLSTVHVHAEIGEDGKILFRGDSDALISKGLVALLVNGLTGCSLDQIVNVKPEFIQAVGITASLTPGRNNGFFNMFKLMLAKAKALNDEVAPAAGANEASASSSAPAPLESPKVSITNSMSRQKEALETLEKGVVNMYVCGVTVYDLCHLGHARIMVFFDVVARYLRHVGYKVNYVRNVTDIDDKIIKRSQEAGISFEELARQMEKEMQLDAKALGCEPPTAEPRVSEHLNEIVGMVKGLEEKGFAYSGASGGDGLNDVYFRVRRFSNYGRLSRCNLDANKVGDRVEASDVKEAPEDFVLWKAAKPREPQWPSPWGAGRPGWHIECSAMARKLLGDTLDIHGGGPDLMFPHHENEIAQSEAHNGKQYVRTWMHCGAIRSTGEEKMSKSLGNFVTIRDVLNSYDGEAVRFYLISSQYRLPVLYGEDSLAKAQERLLRFYSALRGVVAGEVDDKEAEELTSALRTSSSSTAQRFEAALSNDFDTVSALATMTEVAKEILALRKEEQVADGATANGAARTEKMRELGKELRGMGLLLGILSRDPEAALRGRSGAAGDSAADAEFEAKSILPWNRQGRTEQP
eukprot:TRINITY_DN34404_c0_g1_i2.p1 TRINITY_DN34404_c0_g1~~TRINITY_DN34404_c0_g1_i2.p1  ORF type:complete len:757 (-),score=192.44 TRINITY_DN34404_c0_g1_i2:48-2264(-)